MGAGSGLHIRNVLVAGTGSRADVHLLDGQVHDVVEPRGPLTTGATTGDVDGTGYVLLPSFVEPHAHLDKVFIIDEEVPPGDLHAAISLFKERHYSRMDSDDIYRRARKAVRIAVARGITAIRTHVDIGASAGVAALEPLLALRSELRGVIDIQIVACVLPPALGERQKDAVLKAVEAGVDLIGGCPSLEEDPRAMIDWIVGVAKEAGLPVDFHLDEAESSTSYGMRALLSSLDERHVGITASHCVSLGSEEESDLDLLIEGIKGHDLAIVTLPQTNLLLQARDYSQCKPRGMPPLRTLLDRGVTLAAGGDNWRDPFNPLSRIDSLEILSLLVSAGHLTPDEALDLVTAGPRRVLGLPEVGVEVGSPADLVMISGDSTWEALADASDDRIVIKAGVIVARTELKQTLDPRLV